MKAHCPYPRAARALALLFAVLLLVQSPARARPTRQKGNLLHNPGFEGIGVSPDNALPNPGNWTRATFNGREYGEIFTPEGWVTWWQEGDGFRRPECKVIPNEAPFNGDPARIHRGYYSGMCFTFYGKHHAGYYQVVRDVPPGATVRGTIHAHAWACSEDSPPRSCGDPFAFYFQVGIDPHGGVDPFASTVIWSAPAYRYDEYGVVGPVEATVGPGGAVTFFTRAYGKWPLKHNDAYWDDPSLVLAATTPATTTPTPELTVTPELTPTPSPTLELTPAPGISPTPTPSAPTATPAPASPTPQPPSASPTPRPPTPAATPAGTKPHIVRAGETLLGIARLYGIPLEELRRLNAGRIGPGNLIYVGQTLYVPQDAVPRRDATPEPTTVTASPTSTPTAMLTATHHAPEKPAAEEKSKARWEGPGAFEGTNTGQTMQLRLGLSGGLLLIAAAMGVVLILQERRLSR